MGKAKAPKRNAASSSSGPYSRPSQKTNNVFKFNTNVGQHILKNPGVADAIVHKAELKPTDTVLEIGPGTGNLTVRILEKSKKLIAIEFDPRMAAEVTKRVQGTPEQRKLEVMLGDAIKVDWVPFDVLISNTPYQISSPLVFKMLAMPKPPRQAILMFQLEFGQRLVAKPGDKLYGRLSVNANFWATCSNVMKVSKANFRPPPQVDSCVVRIVPKQGAERPTIAFEEFDGLLRVKNQLAWYKGSPSDAREGNHRNPLLGKKSDCSQNPQNYRTWAAMNNVPLDDSLVEDDEDDAMEMDDDADAGAEEDDVEPMDDDTPEFFKELSAAAGKAPEKTKSKRKKTKVAALVRSKIERALESTDLLEKRARSCDETDFLKLLSALNSEGIHFA
ncbi:dimethyladenosine transferase [Colletotrichum spaethianum]|uniref:rRNA adenine N(6)-methyltransferase n=1 Tax=Colletotrichum spaethianum TaxID=700344 RepID=A0AA37PDQ2_9PEZI|nr:dimethyladenosine transferase [Colletotrichum spaethianum]GKT50390.1 dimethyladenosine transferase [Colletotrichum spaethianum]